MRIKIFLIFITILIGNFILIDKVEAQTYRCARGTEYDGLVYMTSNCDGSCTGGYSCTQISLGNTGGTVTLTDPLGGKVTPEQLIGRVIKAALGIVGSLALVMFIYGGFTWMTAAGNKEGIEKGKNIILWATIGLVVIFAAYAMVNFVLRTVIGIQ
jgi:hypothetical protein